MRVLFIDIDTLRPDHMGCYGYERNTTPNLDKLAKDGIRFTNCYCSDAPCLPSRAALVSGMFGIHNRAVNHAGACADIRTSPGKRSYTSIIDDHNLINTFRSAGFYTASVSSFAERHSSYWFHAGFNETYNCGCKGMESGEMVLPYASEWLKKNREKDQWFLHVHFWDPHTPYRAPMEFGEPFEDVPIHTWITEEKIEKHRGMAGPHGAREVNMYNDEESEELPRQPGKVENSEDLIRLINGYDTGILYTDYLIGKLIDQLKEYGVYEDTAIIVTSDHGENLGELGIYSEHATADYATCHIPLILKWPGGMKNRVNENLHYNIDLLPTLAELLNRERHENWDGQSYAEELFGRECLKRRYLVLSQMSHVCQRSVRYGKWLYIRTYHDGYHLFDQEMLFDLENDIYEEENLRDKYPEICAEACRYLLEWHDAMMQTADDSADPLWVVVREGGPVFAKGFLSDYVERLEKTERAEAAKILKAKMSDEYY